MILFLKVHNFIYFCNIICMENTIKNVDIRTKTLKNGLSYPFDDELLCLILGSGTKDLPIDKMSKKILEVLDSCEKDKIIESLLSIKGIGKSKALAVAAALEFGKRRNTHLKARIKTPQDIIPFVRNYAINNREFFLSITLNGGHEIIQIHVVSIGTINRTIIHPREVFYEAIRENASAVIVCHNHPSGNCEPSREDIETTKMLLEASKVLGIPILDHVIISSENYFSFMEHKLVFNELQ